MIERRPTQRKLEPSKVLLNGKRIHDAEEDPKKFARRIVRRRKPKNSRAELVAIGDAMKARLRNV